MNVAFFAKNENSGHWQFLIGEMQKAPFTIAEILTETTLDEPNHKSKMNRILFMSVVSGKLIHRSQLVKINLNAAIDKADSICRVTIICPAEQRISLIDLCEWPLARSSQEWWRRMVASGIDDIADSLCESKKELMEITDNLLDQLAASLGRAVESCSRRREEQVGARLTAMPIIGATGSTYVWVLPSRIKTHEWVSCLGLVPKANH